MNHETMPFPDGYPELLEQVGQVIFRHLRHYDVARDSAISMTFSIVEAVCLNPCAVTSSRSYPIARNVEFIVASDICLLPVQLRGDANT